MSKIKHISIQNFKAISAIDLDLNGCSAIIVGRNESGKSTLLKGIPDRIRGEKPELIVKYGEESGKGSIELTTGERFDWTFNIKGQDKLTFTTKDGIQIPATKAIGERFFKPVFDIDVFLRSMPKDRSKMVQKLVGVDFTQIDAEYKSAYEIRTGANKNFTEQAAKLASFGTPDEVKGVDVDTLLKEKEAIRTKLNADYLENVQINKKAREIWTNQCETIRKEIQDFNDLQAESNVKFNAAKDAVSVLTNLGYTGKEAHEFVVKLGKGIEKFKEYSAPPEPTYVIEKPDDSELQAIDQKIANAAAINVKASNYTTYVAQQETASKAKESAEIADAKVKEIEQRKKEMIEGSKFPEGITIENDEIFVIEGEMKLPLDKNQISTSKLYCTALRLAALNLGEVKSLHFDASTLDNNTLAEIQKWADSNQYQLLIEQPSREGSEISYTLIETTE